MPNEQACSQEKFSGGGEERTKGKVVRKGSPKKILTIFKENRPSFLQIFQKKIPQNFLTGALFIFLALAFRERGHSPPPPPCCSCSCSPHVFGRTKWPFGGSSSRRCTSPILVGGCQHEAPPAPQVHPASGQQQLPFVPHQESNPVLPIGRRACYQ